MKKIIYIAAVIATLVGCNNENNEMPSAENRAVEFTNGVITRACGTEWASGDEIGVYMFGTGTTTIIENKGNIQYYNSKTESGENAAFKVMNTDETIYYPQGDVKVDFLAYYPYGEKVDVEDYIYEIDVTSANQTTPTEIDLMVSKNLKNKGVSNTAMALEFSHALSQLNFVVMAGTGSPELSGLKISVGGLINEASYDLTSGDIDFGSNQPSDLTVINNSAIIIPQTADLTFTFKTDENPEGFTATKENMIFKASENTTLTFILNRTGVSLEGESTINGWTPATGYDDEIEVN